MKQWMVAKVARFAALIVVMTALLGFVVMSLWNILVPELFHGPILTFWQAVGLLLLSHILLRGWGPWRHAEGWHRDRWKKRLEEKLAAMAPEEREKFKEEWRHRCGWTPGESEVRK